MGWFKTILKVTNTASGFLLNSGYLAESGVEASENSDEVITNIGKLQFIRNVREGKSYLEAKDGKEYYVYFSRINNEGELFSKMILTDGKGRIDLGNTMEKYIDGYITYLPIEQGKPESKIAFTAEYIIKEATRFIQDETGNQYELKYYFDQDTRRSKLTFSSEAEFTALNMSFSDRNGINFNLEDNTIVKVLGSVYVAEVELPEGCSHVLPFQDVRIELTIPKSHLNSLRQQFSAKTC